MKVNQGSSQVWNFPLRFKTPRPLKSVEHA